MRRRLSGSLGLWAIVGLFGLPATAQDPEDVGRRWRSLELPGITLISDAAPRRLLAIGEDLRANRATLLSLLE